MKKLAVTLSFFLFLFSPQLFAQPLNKKQNFTRHDTLRGSITPGRAWWDVLRYDVEVTPDYNKRTIAGKTTILYKIVQAEHSDYMQIDLQAPLQIDTIFYENKLYINYPGKPYYNDGNAWFIPLPKAAKNSTHSITIAYHGTPREAVHAPWDGGWVWVKDAQGRPWMTVACQGLGASVWYPCKDHQSDEPDNGASLTMIVPDTLVAVGNGRLQSKKINGDGTASYTWQVINPINNYNIIPYIGKYVNFSETYHGEKGQLDVNYWVIDYNLSKAKNYLHNEAVNTLKSFEYWFGPYPFYEDGYKLIDVPHTGMEHQSAVAYGNWYAPGYRGRDGSGTGWGMKWDFIVVHESAHEWFGNNITTKDLADMWVHEGFANYSETLFVDYMFGKTAADEYSAGTRRGIRNDRPIIARYDVNEQGSGDMYPKGGNLLHSIRHSLDNDELFRSILRGLNKEFYHQTVSSKQVENYISKKSGYDYSKVFEQYLRTTQIPKLEFYIEGQKAFYRWTNCVTGFNLPLVLRNDNNPIKIIPSETWKATELK